MTSYTNLETAILAVTFEQLDRCHRIIDLNKKEVFYQVESESDSLVEYEVRYVKGHGFTCTCAAGQEGFAHCFRLGVCKHCVWSVAHSREFHTNEIKEQGNLTALINQGVSRDDATAMAYAELPVECEQFTVVVSETSSSLDGMKWEIRNGVSIPMGY